MKQNTAEALTHLSDAVASSRVRRTSDVAPPPSGRGSWLELCMAEGKPPASDEELVERTHLTPNMAAYLLTRNAENQRRMSDEHLSKLTRALETGHWRFRADVIRVSKSGNLIDGQHRCQAIVDANVAADTLIVYGLDDDLIRDIDTTLRPRSHADGLRVKGLPYSNKLSAAASVIRAIETEEFSSRKRATNYELDETLTDHEKGLRWAVANVPQKIEPGIQAGAKEIYSAFAYLYPVNPDRVAALLDQYVHEGAPAGNPMNTLRRAVNNFPKESPRVRLMKTLRCLEAGLNGESLKLVKADENVLSRVRERRERELSDK